MLEHVNLKAMECGDLESRESDNLHAPCAEDACMLVRWAVQSGPLGKGRVPLLKRLADAVDPTKQTPATRAKAIKAITTVVKADTSVLGLPEIQQCVNRALKVGHYRFTPAYSEMQHANACMRYCEL